MGNCFHPRTDVVTPLGRSDNSRVVAYAASIPLTSSEYISALAGEESRCCLAQDHFLSVISNSQITLRRICWDGQMRRSEGR
jgi:hypothetical protein